MKNWENITEMEHSEISTESSLNYNKLIIYHYQAGYS